MKPELETSRDLGDVWEEELFASAKLSARRAWGLTGCALALATLGLGHSLYTCLLYTSPSPRDRTRSRMPSSA